MTRGRLLAAAALALVALAVAGWRLRPIGGPAESSEVALLGVRVAPAPPPVADGPVRNVVLCLGDGLGISQLVAGRIRAFGPDGRLTLERLPVSGWVATHSEKALVTKSDAAATALASGRKTVNGHVGTDAAGRRLPSLAERLHARGGAVGLVTTARITDATPAAFGAHVARRRDEAAIAQQLLDAGFELLLGGGRRFFVPADRPGGARTDGLDLLAMARERGYQVIALPRELESARLPLLGLFAAADLPLVDPQPPLAELASFSLARLHETGRPFFLLLEDERIDTYGHDNDFAGLSRALVEFDEAVERAVDFAARDGETLVVVTGDHATGGLVILPGRDPERLALRWLGDLHSGEPVPLFAYGPGARAFSGALDNTDIPRRMATLLGFDLEEGG